MRKEGLGSVYLWPLLILPLALGLFPIGVHAENALWSYQPGEEIKWQRLTRVGTLLVGTDDSVACLDPQTGKVIWKRDDLKKIPDFAVDEIEGSPLVLITDNQGRSRTQLHAVEMISGKDFWQTERLKGSAVGVYPVYEKNLVVLLTTSNASQSKDSPDMIALDLTSGDVRWESAFPNKVDLHAVEGAGKWFVKYDLSGHAPPVVDGDSIYFTFAGLHRFDLNTGKLVWAVPYDVTEGRLKRGNSQAIVESDTVYTSAKGQLRAHDKATGNIKWTSKDFGGGVAQMIAKGGVVYGRMGGHFYDYSKREWALEKPLGVVAVSKSSGQTVWMYDKAQDGITNMLLVDGESTLLISDSKNLIGLDTSGEGKIKENFKIPLEFKNKIGGGAKAARSVMKFGRGGLVGMSKKSHDEDPPVGMVLRPNGTVVVRATQHMLAFDPRTRQIPWSVEYDAPGVAGWEKIVYGAIAAAAYGYEYNRASHSEFGTGENRQANEAKNNVMRDYQNLFEKRFSATQATAQYVYILTNVEDSGDKGAGIVGVNSDTGASDRQVLLGTKEPSYVVDDLTGRVFLLGKDSKTLNALPVN